MSYFVFIFISCMGYASALKPSDVLSETWVDLNPRTYAFKAYHSQWETGVRLKSFFSMDYFIHKRVVDQVWILLPISLTFAPFKTREMPQSFGWNTGLGIKVRLSEWVLKTSLFLEGHLRGGQMHHRWPHAPRLSHTQWVFLPDVALGFQTVFDTGASFFAGAGLQQSITLGAQKGPRWMKGLESFLFLGLGVAF